MCSRGVRILHGFVLVCFRFGGLRRTGGRRRRSSGGRRRSNVLDHFFTFAVPFLDEGEVFFEGDVGFCGGFLGGICNAGAVFFVAGEEVVEPDAEFCDGGLVFAFDGDDAAADLDGRAAGAGIFERGRDTAEDFDLDCVGDAHYHCLYAAALVIG